MSKKETESFVLINTRIPGLPSLTCKNEVKIQLIDKFDNYHNLEIRDIRSVIPLPVDYADYINSQEWKDRKAAYFNDHPDKKRCLVCRRKEDLNVHHLFYERLGHEKDNDLECLCEKCHDRLHHYANDVKNYGVNIYYAIYKYTKERGGVLPDDVNRVAYLFACAVGRIFSYQPLKDYIETTEKEPYGVLFDRVRSLKNELSKLSKSIDKLKKKQSSLQTTLEVLFNMLPAADVIND